MNLLGRNNPNEFVNKNVNFKFIKMSQILKDIKLILKTFLNSNGAVIVFK